MSDNKVRGQIASGLEEIARILTRHQIIRDAGPLYRAASTCREHAGPGMWGYELNNLVFREPGNLKISPADAEEISIELSVDVEGFCDPEPGSDPLRRLIAGFQIQGRFITDINNGAIRTARSVWRLERDINDPDDNPPEFSHPCYHFHFGDNQLNAMYDAHRPTNDAVLLLDSPRLPHPPLDGFLGIEFVLLNFISSSRLSFREEGSYGNIIGPRQVAMWQSYSNSLAGHWGANAHLLSWAPVNIWPALVQRRQ